MFPNNLPYDLQFLFLRQVGQGVNVRLSDPLEISPSESATNLLCVSNERGLLFAGTKDGKRNIISFLYETLMKEFRFYCSPLKGREIYFQQCY